jgi:hypothetical protein
MHLDMNFFIFYKKRKVDKVEKLIEFRKEALNKFVISNKQNIEDNLGEKLVNQQEIHQKELENNENTIEI